MTNWAKSMALGLTTASRGTGGRKKRRKKATTKRRATTSRKRAKRRRFPNVRVMSDRDMREIFGGAPGESLARTTTRKKRGGGRRLVKGSAAAKARMAKLRAMRRR